MWLPIRVRVRIKVPCNCGSRLGLGLGLRFLVIVAPDALVEERAVVIEPLDTLVTGLGEG